MSRDLLDCMRSGDHVGALRASAEHVDTRRHAHPRPRGDTVLCDGRCGQRYLLGREVDAATADVYATSIGWLVTESMARSFHFCGACRVNREE